MKNRPGWLLIIWFAWPVLSAVADPPRVLGEGQVPNDARLGELKTLNGHFPFMVPENVADWHLRAEQLRRRVLVATGLWPMPERTPLKPVIYGKVTRPGFTVERVYFQSLPGHFVTGLLFRPEAAVDDAASRCAFSARTRRSIATSSRRRNRTSACQRCRTLRRLGADAENWPAAHNWLAWDA